MSSSITLIVVPAEDADSFEAMPVDERRQRSWQTFPVRCGRYLCTFLMTATDTDLGVFGGEPEIEQDGQQLEACMIDREMLVEVLPQIEAMVEADADETARVLHAHGGGTADLARVVDALKTGAWPESGDPAEEAAAFARHLLSYARVAKQEQMGVCWEYRGPFAV